MGATSVEGFKRLLATRFGSVLKGWRKGLDNYGNGRLNFSEFSMAARRIGYRGSIKNIWRFFDADKSGHITLNELAPDAWETVQAFRKTLFDKFGCVLVAWAYGLDLERRGQLPINIFQQRVKKSRYVWTKPACLVQCVAPFST